MSFLRILISLMVFVIFIVTNHSPTLASEKIKWKHTSSSPATAWTAEHEEYFANWVKKQSEGRLEIQNFYSDELGFKGTDYLRVLKGGLVEFVKIISPYVSGDLPILALADLPFLMPTPEEFFLVSDKVIPVYNKVLGKDWNSKLLYIYPVFPQLLGTKAKINSPEDFRGLKIRVAGSAQAQLAKSLGAVPVTITMPELYPALQRGIADAVIAGIDLYTTLKLYEVVDYLAMVPINTFIMFECANNDDFEQLPKDLQQVLLSAVEPTQKVIAKNLANGFNDYRDRLISKGMTTYTPPAAVVDFMKSQGPPIWEKWAEKEGPVAQELLKVVRERLER